MEPMNLTDEQWRERLSAEQYAILRQKGTERPWSGPYLEEKRSGTYLCGGCGAELFPSTAKFDSGSGWPSFFAPVEGGAVELHEDRSHGMVRTEVTCGRCGGHLGHVFPDGPGPKGERYCINGCALELGVGVGMGPGTNGRAA